MVSYLKKIALRGMRGATNIYPPVHYDSISFVEKMGSNDTTSQDLSISSSNEPKIDKPPELLREENPKSILEQKKNMEQQTTNEKPFFTDHHKKRKNFPQEESVKSDTTNRHIIKIRNPESVENENVNIGSSSKKRDETTLLKPYLHDKKEEPLMQRKSQPEKQSARIIKSDIVGKERHFTISNAVQRTVENHQQYRETEKKNNSSKTTTTLPTVVTPEPIQKGSVFTLSEGTPRAAEMSTSARAELTHPSSGVNIRVGKVEVHVEKPHKTIATERKSSEGFERYWLQRNYYRII
jgi:hypothetical protein